MQLALETQFNPFMIPFPYLHEFTDKLKRSGFLLYALATGREIINVCRMDKKF